MLDTYAYETTILKTANHLIENDMYTATSALVNNMKKYVIKFNHNSSVLTDWFIERTRQLQVHVECVPDHSKLHRPPTHLLNLHLVLPVQRMLNNPLLPILFLYQHCCFSFMLIL